MASKKTSVCALIFIVSATYGSQSVADWSFFGATADRTVETYIDKDSIRWKGNKFKVWVWSDLKESLPNAPDMRSSADLMEVDCENRQSRGLAFRAYSRSGLKGNLLESDDITGDWTHAEPDTLPSRIMKSLCKK